MAPTIPAAKKFSIMSPALKSCFFIINNRNIFCLNLLISFGPYFDSRSAANQQATQTATEQACVPVVVDAGLGQPSHASEALEMGADAVLVNTAIAVARDPARTAAAFALAVVAGREAYLAGVPTAAVRSWKQASASSPLTGFVNRE